MPNNPIIHHYPPLSINGIMKKKTILNFFSRMKRVLSILLFIIYSIIPLSKKVRTTPIIPSSSTLSFQRIMG